MISFCYPLGADPEARTSHWPDIRCPVLVINGDRDPLADHAALAARFPRLEQGTLRVLGGLGHDLSSRREEVLDLVAAFAATLSRP